MAKRQQQACSFQLKTLCFTCTEKPVIYTTLLTNTLHTTLNYYYTIQNIVSISFCF